VGVAQAEKHKQFDDWWMTHMATQTEKARQRAERLFPTRVLSNKAKREIFMDTFHWVMLEQRAEVWKLYDEK
jgi:hypothetical protein